MITSLLMTLMVSVLVTMCQTSAHDDELQQQPQSLRGGSDELKKTCWADTSQGYVSYDSSSCETNVECVDKCDCDAICSTTKPTANTKNVSSSSIDLIRTSAVDDYTLGLQKCQGSTTWTLHGLWPKKQDCGGPGFDESQVQDLLSQMGTYWLSCPEYSSSNKEFWTHEWSKHGSCSGLSQHDFFSDGLKLRSQYANFCYGQSDGKCSLTCSGATGPCEA